MQVARGPPGAPGTAPQLLQVLLLGLQLAEGARLHCVGATYPGNGRCCQECAPGFGMKKRCDDNQDTQCQPCQFGYYNEAFNYQPCQPCTQCFHRSGSRMQQQCTSTRDTVCSCQPGMQPRHGYKLGADCVPCPPGHFSPGHHQACKPWTNCSLAGKPTLRPANSSVDTVCDERNATATRPTDTPSPTSTQGLASQSSSSPSREPPGGLFPAGRALALGLGLGLLASGALLVLLLHCRLWRRLPGTPSARGGNNFRTPVQEEHADAHSSLAKI
ncbi:tumor necrosis factor receptor superfamily member 4 [Sorex fumeus]|uniref:tumor necrosis factor receptor superfamily member 4 n=1 Tax=Sorex fumeus TaxID=62283 RepID=UPI0024ACD158|nr:tumor necrosis factor receptor superfamily member 4 [Sorex fumeus]